jgi:hypothetical protein
MNVNDYRRDDLNGDDDVDDLAHDCFPVNCPVFAWE